MKTMKKELIVILILGCITNNLSAQVKTISNSPFITKINDSTITLNQKAIVPPNQVFNIHKLDGSLLRSFRAGETVTWTAANILNAASKILKPTQDCYKVTCPSSAPAGATCWDCVAAVKE